MSAGKYFTDGETAYIRENCTTMTITEMSKAMGRMYSSIHRQIRSAGLVCKKRKSPVTYKEKPVKQEVDIIPRKHQKLVLGFFEWADMLQAVFARLGMTCPNRADLALVYHPRAMENWATIFKHGDKTIWADKLYIAHQISAGDVVYDYISVLHIEEEKRGWVKRRDKMPDDVRRQLDHADWVLHERPRDKCWFRK